jgi:hypothetical protein
MSCVLATRFLLLGKNSLLLQYGFWCRKGLLLVSRRASGMALVAWAGTEKAVSHIAVVQISSPSQVQHQRLSAERVRLT